ncbi:MAG: hypothetical protein R3232_04915 [Clostridia bacterium]|nr:hypothetical protein [Clostridia bacterium]
MIRDKVINNSLHVLDILRNISKTKELEATIVFSANEIYRGTLYYYRRDKQLFFKLNVIDEKFEPRMKVHVSFLLKETVFSFDASILEITENVLELSPPVIFTSSFKRHYSRYAPTDEEALLVKMPDGSLHDVKDITTSGVAFYSEKLEYSIGSRIRNMQILLKDDVVCLDADVKYIIEADNGNFFYGTEFANNNWFSHYSLFQYIFKNTYPDIHQLFEFPKEDIYLLYDKSNYFHMDGGNDIEQAFNDMYNVMGRINQYPQVTANPVFVHNDKMYLAASALRIYNRTFIAQHLAAIPESRLFPTSKSSIYLGLSDYLICNPYYNYYLTYFDAREKWHHRMYGSIAGYINDEKKYLYDTTEFFRGSFREFTPISGNRYKAMTMDDPAEFIEFAQRKIPYLIRSTYGYDEANIGLEEIKQVYELIGLYVERCIIKVSKDGKPIAYAVCESYTPGLNMYNILDLCKIYIVDKDADLNSMMSAIMLEAYPFYDKFEKTKMNIFINIAHEDIHKVNIPGIEYQLIAGRGIVDRSGVIEYKNLLLNMSR